MEKKINNNNNIQETSSPDEQSKTKAPTRASSLIAKRNYYARNREKILEKHKEWRQRNKEHLAEIQKESQRKYRAKKELELKLMQRLVESQEESDEEDVFMSRLNEVLHIASFYNQLGIKRPIDFYKN